MANGHIGEFCAIAAFQSFTHTSIELVLYAWLLNYWESVNCLHRFVLAQFHETYKTHMKINIAHFESLVHFCVLFSIFFLYILIFAHEKKNEAENRMTFGSCLSLAKPKILRIFLRLFCSRNNEELPSIPNRRNIYKSWTWASPR